MNGYRTTVEGLFTGDIPLIHGEHNHRRREYNSSGVIFRSREICSASDCAKQSYVEINRNPQAPI
jgi:hypothetical protein